MREGVPYVTREKAEQLKDSLLPKEAAASDAKPETPRSNMVLSKKSDIETTDQAIEGLRSWLTDEAKKEETEFEVIETNAYLRRSSVACSR